MTEAGFNELLRRASDDVLCWQARNAGPTLARAAQAEFARRREVEWARDWTSWERKQVEGWELTSSS